MKTILMSMRVTESNTYKEKRSSIADDCIEYFEKMGYLVILVPVNSENIEHYFTKNIDLVVLTGGNNINPELYNSDEILDEIYVQRDKIETMMVDLAVQKDINIVGICRGFQFLNVYFGGQISHHISHHVNKIHTLSSKLKYLNNVSVNSFHNHGVTEALLGNNLISIAYTEDGYVEAFLDTSKSILGIQWHPERQDKKFDKILIDAFVKGKL